MGKTEPTMEEIAQMRATVAEHDARMQEEANAAADDALKPLTNVIDDERFVEAMDDLRTAQEAVRDLPQLADLINSMLSIHRVLPGAVGRAKDAVRAAHIAQQSLSDRSE